MSTDLCLRCLRRSLQISKFPTNTESRATFSTSAILTAKAPAAKKGAAPLTKGKKLVLAKRQRATTSRPPAVGERKAIRKRIVLSNTNALAVEGLQDFSKDKIDEEGSLKELHGKVLGLSDATVDALRALHMFKPTQAWHLFRRPATVVRDETLNLARELKRTEEEKAFCRTLYFGEAGSGKTVMLLQAAAIAHLRGWVVIHFPEARDLVNSHTSYAPIRTSKQASDEPLKYMQAHYTAELLNNIVIANRQVLSEMQLSQQHDLPIPVQSNMSLDRFAQLGADDVELAWPIWRAFWAELTTPSKPDQSGFQRAPVLVSLDGLHHIMRDSAYIHPDMTPIHAHDLALVDFYASLCANHLPMPNGGAVLGATSGSDKPSAPSMDFFLHNNSVSNDAQKQTWNPYIEMDQRVASALSTVPCKKLQGLDQEESRGVLEYYARSGILRANVTDSLVNEKWSLAGGGIVGALEKSTVRTPYYGLA